MEYNALRLERMSQMQRIPGESAHGYFSRVRTTLDQLESTARSQWTGRRTWSTHTYPGGCWICDCIALCESVLSEYRKYADLEENDIRDREVIVEEESNL